MQFLHTYYYTMLLTLMLSLTACNSSFDCPHSAGISCQSLEQINRRIDAGTLPLLALQDISQEQVVC
jgi:hypothetical protein